MRKAPVIKYIMTCTWLVWARCSKERAWGKPSATEHGWDMHQPPSCVLKLEQHTKPLFRDNWSPPSEKGENKEPWVSQQGLDRKTYRGSDVARCPLAQQLQKRRGMKPIPINKFVTSAVLTNRLDVQPSPHLIAINNWCRWEGTSYVSRCMCFDL